MLVIESVSDLTRLLIWTQYLYKHPSSLSCGHLAHLVTLNTLRRRTQRRTESPSDGATSNSVKITLATTSHFWIFLSYLQEAGDNNEEVKPIEQTLEIKPRSQGKDFQQQFQSEEGDKDNVGGILQTNQE